MHDDDSFCQNFKTVSLVQNRRQRITETNLSIHKVWFNENQAQYFLNNVAQSEFAKIVWKILRSFLFLVIQPRHFTLVAQIIITKAIHTNLFTDLYASNTMLIVKLSILFRKSQEYSKNTSLTNKGKTSRFEHVIYVKMVGLASRVDECNLRDAKPRRCL